MADPKKAKCAPGCDASSQPLPEITRPPEGCCAEGGGGDPVTIDSSCDDPVFVEICNPATQPVQVISETEQLGCVTDPATGAVTGRVFLVPTFDADGNMTATRMIMVATDGTVTDPYAGAWEECPGAGETSDVELNFLCVVDTATGNVIQQVIQEIVYDSAGERLTTRFVDRATGAPVSLPGGTTIGVCPEDECLPEPFSTECFEILEEQVQYDNAGGTDPQLCGAPASGPADGGGNIPFIPCPGNYLITSWMINGAEVITGGPVSFSGQICGSTAGGQIGLHEDWARALNLIDGAAGWTNEYSTECANYVRVLNPDPNREYGAMVITDATDASRVWTITNGVRRTIAEERFTRVYQRECDGSIGTIWLNSTGEVIPQPEGNLQPCGMIEEEACVDCETIVACDTYIGAGESIFTTTPIPFAELPVITPTYSGQEPMDPAQEALLWSGDTAIIPAPVNPTQNQIHVTSGAVLSTTEPLVGPVEISVQMDWRRTGPGSGQLNTGGLFLMNGDTRIAYEFYPGYTPVDATGQLIVTATVPAEDLLAGDIVIVSLSETHHQAQTGGWELSRLLVLEGGVEETQKFLRTICRSCDGRVVSVQDTTFDGITEYEVQGEVSACGEDQETQPEQEPCVTCETLVLCDTVNDPDPTAGIPWNVVEIEEDADDPEHILHFHMSPVDDPSKIGIVTFQSSSAFNTGGCDDPDVDYAISNPSRRTITLDEVAQEMHAFQFNMIDFDTFEPTYIPTGFPIPTRLGGTAYWTGEPGNNVNILPTESNGTGLLIWDNPPETMAIQVGNTGGGNSCSNVDFEALTLGTMNRPFLRTICRDCNGEIVSVSDYEMDGVTPYETVGEVTVCLAPDGTSSDEQPPDCPTAFATECFMQLEGQAQYDNAGGADPAACGAPVSGPGGDIAFPCTGNFLITSWIVDGEEVITAPVPFTGETCGGDGGAGQIGMHADWARTLDQIDNNSGWGIDWSQACQYYVRLLEATKDYGAMIIQDADDASRVWVINGAAQSMSETMYTRVFQQDCDGAITSVWLDVDGNEVEPPQGNLVPCGSGGSDCCEPQPPVTQEVFMDVVRIQDAMFDPGSAYDNVQSVTLTVLSGEVVVSAVTQQPAIPAGVSLTWSVQKDQDGFLIPPQFDATAGGDFILNVTYLGA